MMLKKMYKICTDKEYFFDFLNNRILNRHYIKTPTIMQIEAVECGAAALAMILAYFERHVPLEQLRRECNVSRDGSSLPKVVNVAAKHGLLPQFYQKLEPQGLKSVRCPAILFMDFSHFIVYEGFHNGSFYVNDPACGRRALSLAEMDESFTGVAVSFTTNPFFETQAKTVKWHAMWKKYLLSSGQVALFILLTGLLLVFVGLVQPTFTQIFLDNIVSENTYAWLPTLVTIMVLFSLAQMGLTWLQQFFLLKWQQQLLVNNCSSMVWQVMHKPMEFFLQRSAGDIANRIGLNDTVARLFSGQLVLAFVNVITAFFFLLILWQYNHLLTIVGILSIAVNACFLKRLAYRRRVQSMQMQAESSRLAGTTTAVLQVIESLKASGEENDAFNAFASSQTKMLKLQMESGIINDCAAAMPSYVNALNNIVVLAVGAFAVMHGKMTVGSLVAFQGLMGSFLAPITQLMNTGSAFQQIEGALERIDDVMKYKNDYIFNEKGKKEGIITGSLILKNIVFGYAAKKQVVDDITFELPEGKMLAIVGASGGGKSTVAKLIMGLYHPWQGEIIFSGRLRSEISQAELSEWVRMVDQDISFFTGTIAENITLFDETVGMHEILEACELACIKEEIMSRPNGLQDMLEENGANFSGGQKQRLEIARAFLQKPKLIIMDEATSALDSLLEKRIMDNIRSKQISLLVIAHRLSTVRDADEIIVLDEGRIVERGTHDVLYNRQGFYYNFVNLER